MSTAITHEKIVWHPEGMPSHDVPVNVYLGEGALSSDIPSTHVYLGMGEGRFTSMSAVKTLGEIGVNAVAVVLPFHHLPCEPKNIERTLIEVPQFLAGELGARTGNAELTRKTSLLGHSQSGGGVILSAHAAPELFDHVGVWSPVGLTPDVFGSTPEEKRRTFMRRLLLENTLLPEQSPLRYPRNIIAGAEIMSRIVADTVTMRLPKKLNYALDLNLSPRILELRKEGVNIRVFGAEGDPLFKVKEYREALGEAFIATLPKVLVDAAIESRLVEKVVDSIFVEIPGSHTSPLVTPGENQLRTVGKWLVGARVRDEQLSLAA